MGSLVYAAQMASPSFVSAQLVAPRVFQHFSAHHQQAENEGIAGLAPLPSEEVIQSIVDTAFWTSLRREERYPPRISIAFLSPDKVDSAIRFETPLPLQAHALTRIAPGVERPGIHLAVWEIGGELLVWGATRSLPVLSFIVETVAPGTVVIKHRHREQVAKFVNVAVLEADQVKMLNPDLSAIPGCPTTLHALFGKYFRAARFGDPANVLIRLGTSMRSHGRGGTLLIVPTGSDTWKTSIAHPVPYQVSPAYTELADLIREEPADGNERRWREALLRAVDAVAGLTAIDGATIISERSEVYAFGAKIIRREGSKPVESVVIAEPTEEAPSAEIPVAQLGGTRHISAAQFAHDQRDALAFVSSVDGPFTIFAWSECDSRVYGYKVESLLL